MTFCVENETESRFDFDEKALASQVAMQALLDAGCPYEVEVNMRITDGAGIRAYNQQFRGIDRETDVLSFPAVDYIKPADFSLVTEHENDYSNPDTGEVFLGDILLCAERVISQAQEYGHSRRREFAFLIAHSMLHLLGYDHMTEAEEKEMFSLQEKILEELGITRESEMPE
ncbi:MAG: rRNA maturation RNase YbeY [Lachnospiraceae bacterium]|nr:rRNA maturation RNase YbeY [Lachnospiraceae bacterium]